MMSRLRSARGMVMALVLAAGSFGVVSAAHADYYYNGHHYHHRHYVKDHDHPHGYYRYY